MQIARYILGIICCAVLTGVIQMLFEKHSSASQLIKLVSGLAMAVVMLQPICDVRLPDVDAYFAEFTDDGKNAAQDGVAQSQEYLRQSIKNSTQTYILDKAAALGADVTVDVQLSEDSLPQPIGAVMSGSVSPYVKRQLSYCLKTELNIDEENQKWI